MLALWQQRGFEVVDTDPARGLSRGARPLRPRDPQLPARALSVPAERGRGRCAGARRGRGLPGFPADAPAAERAGRGRGGVREPAIELTQAATHAGARRSRPTLARARSPRTRAEPGPGDARDPVARLRRRPARRSAGRASVKAEQQSLRVETRLGLRRWGRRAGPTEDLARSSTAAGRVAWPPTPAVALPDPAPGRITAALPAAPPAVPACRGAEGAAQRRGDANSGRAARMLRPRHRHGQHQADAERRRSPRRDQEADDGLDRQPGHAERAVRGARISASSACAVPSAVAAPATG